MSSLQDKIVDAPKECMVMKPTMISTIFIVAARAITAAARDAAGLRAARWSSLYRLHQKPWARKPTAFFISNPART